MFEVNWKEIATVGMVLFAVIDIVGTVPIVVDLRQKHGHIESGKASIVAGIIMIVFLFIGEEFLSIIGIDVNSFAVAGSFVLFFLALFVPWAKPRGGIAATVVSIAVAVAIAFFKIGGLEFLWTAPLSFVAGAVVGCLISLPPSRQPAIEK